MVGGDTDIISLGVSEIKEKMSKLLIAYIYGMPLSAIFQLYHGDQF
jgi:hypothetical protein